MLKLTKLLFKEEDFAILNYLDEDGLKIEPDFYVPIIPVVLVNGAIGIGTGYSTKPASWRNSSVYKKPKRRYSARNLNETLRLFTTALY